MPLLRLDNGHLVGIAARSRSEDGIIEALGRGLCALGIAGPEMPWLLHFDMETTMKRSLKLHTFVTTSFGQLKFGIPFRRVPHAEAAVDLVKQLTNAMLAETALNPRHWESLYEYVVAAKCFEMGGHSPALNRCLKEFPTMRPGYLGRVVFPRAMLNALRIKQPYSRSLACAIVGLDMSTSLGVRIEYMVPGSDRIRQTVADAQSITLIEVDGKQVYAYGWRRNGLREVIHRDAFVLEKDIEAGNKVEKHDIGDDDDELLQEAGVTEEANTLDYWFDHDVAPDDNLDIQSESEEAISEEAPEDRPQEVTPCNTFQSVEEPIASFDEFTAILEGGKIPSARCDLCGKWRFLHEFHQFNAFAESNKVFICEYIQRSCDQKSDAREDIGPEETRGSFARWNRKRRRVGPGAYTAPVRCEKCGKARLIHPELHPIPGTCQEWGTACGIPEDPDDAREMLQVERQQAGEPSDAVEIDFAECLESQDDNLKKIPRTTSVSVKVTRPLTEREAQKQYPHLDWAAARLKEAERLFSKFQTLDEPVEAKSVTSKKADFARLLQVYAVKNAETEDPVARVRIVFGGHNVKDVDGKGVDFAVIERFKPTNFREVRIVITFGLSHRWKIHAFDIEGAYLNTLIPDEYLTYCRMPRELAEACRKAAGWKSDPADLKDPVYRVRRALYGHALSGDFFVKECAEILKGFGFELLDAEVSQSLWVLKRDLHGTVSIQGIITMYIDDAVFACPPDVTEEFRKYLEQKYDLRCWETLDQNLGCHYDAFQDPFDAQEFRYITQMTEYCRDSVKLYDLFWKARTGTDAKYSNAVRLPGQPADQVEIGGPPGILGNDSPRFVGKWLYGMRACFPQLAFAVGCLARKVTKWTTAEDSALLRLTSYARRYVAGQSDVEAQVRVDFVRPEDFEKPGNLELAMLVDSDFASEREGRKSCNGRLLLLKGASGTYVVLDYASKLQSLTTLSTAEAELIAIREGAKDLFGVLPLIEGLFPGVEVKLYSDSQAAIGAINGRSSMGHLKRTYDLSLAWLRQQVGQMISHIPGSVNGADIFTKSLPLSAHNWHSRFSLGIRGISECRLQRCTCFCRVYKTLRKGEAPQLGRCLQLTSNTSGRCDQCATGRCSCNCRGHGAPDPKICKNSDVVDNICKPDPTDECSDKNVPSVTADNTGPEAHESVTSVKSALRGTPEGIYFAYMRRESASALRANSIWKKNLLRKTIKNDIHGLLSNKSVSEIYKEIRKRRDARLANLPTSLSIKWDDRPCANCQPVQNLKVRIRMIAIESGPDESGEPPKKILKHKKVVRPDNFWITAAHRYEQSDEPLDRRNVALYSKVIGRCWSSGSVALGEWKELASRGSQLERCFRKHLLRNLTSPDQRLSVSDCRKVLQRTLKRKKIGDQAKSQDSAAERAERIRSRFCPFESASQFNTWLKPCISCSERPRSIRFHPCGCHLMCHECVDSLRPTVCPKCGKDIHSAPQKRRPNMRGFNRIGHEVAIVCNRIRDQMENEGQLASVGQVPQPPPSSGSSNDDMDLSDDDLRGSTTGASERPPASPY